MPALEMAQDNGKLLRWLKADGDAVKKGEPLMEIETDKAAVEIEAPADGILRGITAREGDIIPVGQPIAMIFTQGERQVAGSAAQSQTINASPIARQIAKEHEIDLAQVRPQGKRIEKADVMGYVAKQTPAPVQKPHLPLSLAGRGQGEGKTTLASPKAKRLARERGIDLSTLRGTGPEGAVLTDDLGSTAARQSSASELSTVWRLMAERTTASWTNVPHFFLLREVNASRLISWRTSSMKRTNAKITFTDLLVRLSAVALAAHPRLNARWANGMIESGSAINIGIAVATEEGLVVPVIHRADQLSLKEIAARREDIVERAGANKLRLEDLRDGTFTISNLGMYGVDVFNAIIYAPQAAILAVGRIADRVVPLNGAPAIQPMMMLSLSCDHRVIDGARGAQFLQALADLIEEPLNLVD
jgi:pyruvate dehydrogenase E2 component (dihydrolipoamide acetyltransferase)